MKPFISALLLTVNSVCLFGQLNDTTRYLDDDYSFDLIPYRRGVVYGYANPDKKIIIPPKYTEANFFNKYGLAKVAYGYDNNEKHGFINRSDEEIIPTGKYDMIGDFKDSLTWFGVVVGGKEQENPNARIFKYGLVNIEGKEIRPPIYDEAINFSSNGDAILVVHPVPGLSRCGIINRDFDTIIPPIYETITNFYNGISIVSMPDKNLEGYRKYGIINEKGDIIADIGFDGIFGQNPSSADYNKACISEGLIPVMVGIIDTGKWGFIDLQGKIVIPCKYEIVDRFQDGFAIVGKKEAPGKRKWGIIDKTGKIVVPMEYVSLSHFKSGVFLAEKDNRTLLINSKNEVVSSFKYTLWGFRCGLSKFKCGMKFGFVDETGKEVIPCIFDLVTHFKDDYAGVQQNGKWGVVDKTGKIVVSLAYDGVTHLYDNLFLVVNQIGQYGVIDEKEHFVIPFKNGMLYPVNKNGLFLYLDLEMGYPMLSYLDIKGNEYFE